MPRQTVVIVEDEPLQRMGATAAFAEGGFETVDFETGDEAAIFIRENHASVLALFTDVRMSGEIDGLTLAAQVSFENPKILLLVTSGQADGVLERLPPRSYFIPKPWLSTDIVAAVTHVQDSRNESASRLASLSAL